MTRPPDTLSQTETTSAQVVIDDRWSAAFARTAATRGPGGKDASCPTQTAITHPPEPSG